MLVIQQELDAIDALAAGVHLVDQNAGLSRIGQAQGGHLAILDLEIVWGIIQNEVRIGLDFNGIVRAVLQREEGTAVAVRRDGIYQPVIHPADLKGSVRDALRGLAGVDLDDFDTTHRGVIEPQFLRVIRIDYHGLTLGIGVNGIAWDALHFSHDQRAGYIGEDDLALGIGPVQAV